MRLIDEFKNELMSEFIRLCNGNDFNKLTLLKIGDVIARLHEKYSAIPTADVAPVVHGEWERIEDDYLDLVSLKCSVCGEEWCFEDYDDCVPQNYHYCPNCGAKMDGGAKNGRERKTV